MNKEHFPYTTEYILAAEAARAKGKNLVSANWTEPAKNIHADRFGDFSLDDQTRILMAARINTVSLNSLAKNEWEAYSVAFHLSEAQKTISKIYQNENVQRIARDIKVDTLGNPYNFSLEMLSDEATYLETLAHLTSDQKYNLAAKRRIEQIIAQSDEPSLTAVANYRKNRVDFYTYRSEESYLALKNSYEQTVSVTSSTQRWERLATIAARFSLDAVSFRKLKDAWQAVEVFRYAAGHQSSVKGIFAREFAKTASDSIRHWNWRQTRPMQEDFSYLELDSNSTKF